MAASSSAAAAAAGGGGGGGKAPSSPPRPHPSGFYGAEYGSGTIEVIFGPMFSGKTTELLRRMRRHTVAGRRCMVVKYVKDTRYSRDKCCTHDMQRSDARSAARLCEVEDADDYDVIGVDEGQFFPDLVEFCETEANHGKTVIVAALDGTFQRKPFGRVLELVPLAESVTKLSAVCMICRKDAAFSRRLGRETAVEVIGGEDKYMAVCRSCYTRHATPGRPITEFFPTQGTGPVFGSPTSSPVKKEQQQQQQQQ